jgi:hypothetical protein
MKSIAHIWICLLVALAMGCHARPDAGMAAAEVRVIAKPKAGLTEGFARVPVYDAAPVRPAAAGAFEHVDYSQLTDIIVWLQPATTGAAITPSSLSLDIDPGNPSATVHPASVGGKVLFHNRSSHAVAIYSVSDGNEFELPAIAPGATGEYTIRSEGMIELLSDPARPPIAQLYAAPSPWVARVRSGRSIMFNHVPPGQYQAICWHPRLPGSSAELTLSAGELARSTLTVGVNSLLRDQSP